MAFVVTQDNDSMQHAFLLRLCDLEGKGHGVGVGVGLKKSGKLPLWSHHSLQFSPVDSWLNRPTINLKSVLKRPDSWTEA